MDHANTVAPKSRNDLVRIAQAFDYVARAHTDQRRKSALKEPYVNHLAEVAYLVSQATHGNDADLVVAALLHDAIEDQPERVTYERIEALFGADVAALVAEVTDDKSLLKADRKRMQVETAPHKSPRAKMIKIADKTANVRSLRLSPPDWPQERKREYVNWAINVVAGCKGVNKWLEAQFADECQQIKALYAQASARQERPESAAQCSQPASASAG